jgi:hypothetical protein
MSLKIAQAYAYHGNEWWDWWVWIEGSPEELDAVDHVTYKLHPSFADPVRRVHDRKSKFQLRSQGWGTFPLHVRIVKKDGEVVQLRHDLVLEYPSTADASASTAPVKRPHFLSYSRLNAATFAAQLAQALAACDPPFPVWLDQRELPASESWAKAVQAAVRDCETFLFVLTRDSASLCETGEQEWEKALRYKKPITMLRLDPSAEPPIRLTRRAVVDFTGDFDIALASLRNRLQWLARPAGQLEALRERLADAEVDLSRATGTIESARIREELDSLKRSIAEQEEVLADPNAAARRTEENIARSLGAECDLEAPLTQTAKRRVINRPEAEAPAHFQNRTPEVDAVAAFLRSDEQRLLTVVGRGGSGKTALVCRVLMPLESNVLPNGQPLAVDGLVYMSSLGSQRISVRALLSDLARLLPAQAAARLETVQRAAATVAVKMRALRAAFPSGRTIVLFDGFDSVVDPGTLETRDPNLAEALYNLVDGPPHGLKLILTTRILPGELAATAPERRMRIELEGLGAADVENLLRALDTADRAGVRSAPKELLAAARERTGGNPRALETLYAILAADRTATLSEVLDQTAGFSPGNVLEGLIGEAFSRLDPAAEQVVCALAIYGRPVAPSVVDFLLLPYAPAVNSEPVLERLAQMYVARVKRGCYYLQQVDLPYALRRIPRGEPSDAEQEPPLFTQHALFHRAADYFTKTRRSKENCHDLDDLAPQLAEFEMCYAGEEFDRAAQVLFTIDDSHLRLWGYTRLTADLHGAKGPRR